MDLDELQQLIRILETSELAELEIEEEGRRVRLRKPSARSTAALVEAAPPPSGPAAADGLPEDESLTTIKSPMVGTFYAAPAPDEPPFVRVGDAVEDNQVVGIVEAMKLKNEVTAQFPAIIEQALVQNGEAVEYGQPLFIVRPLV